MTFRPVDSKREEYRKYLERAGVMETLTRVLVSLYEEQDKGIDALEYVRNHLLENHPSQNSTEEELKAQIARLVTENNMLRKRLSQYEEVPPPAAVASPSKSQTHHKSDVASVHSGQSKTSKVSNFSRNNPSSEKSLEHHGSPSSSLKE
ncbi:c-Myc-binding protein [Frankliniella fusca]|uniref:c-Myc-binding protein n=1 Tax=Frankliniella fusca TaxID=407009 RepID=A0AAE1HKL8_9NEOP|nr:c-Myc-binding protein [Frankliniella fusca]